MLSERFMQDLPDEVPEEVHKAAAEGDPEAVEAIDMHAHLLTQLRKLQKFRAEALQKHHIALNPDHAPIIRLNLITQHGMGVMAPGRLRMEIDWVRIQQESLDQAVMEATGPDKPPGKLLFMPDGTGVEIPPAGTNGDG
jgi:hypothetical protein